MKVTFKMTGFDQLRRKLEQVGERAQAVSGEKLTLNDLAALNPQPEEWLAAGPKVQLNSFNDLVSSPEWNAYVQSTTPFAGVREMLQQEIANRVRAKMFGSR